MPAANAPYAVVFEHLTQARKALSKSINLGHSGLYERDRVRRLEQRCKAL